MFYEPFKRILTIIAYAYMIKEPFKRALTIIVYAYMSKEPFKRALTIVAYAYMSKEPFKRSLTIISNASMFKDRKRTIPYPITLPNYTLSYYIAELYPILIHCRNIPYPNTLQSTVNQIRAPESLANQNRVLNLVKKIVHQKLLKNAIR